MEFGALFFLVIEAFVLIFNVIILKSLNLKFTKIKLNENMDFCVMRKCMDINSDFNLMMIITSKYVQKKLMH